MAETVLSNAIIAINETGFFTYGLPFVVTFVILYGLLDRLKILGKNNKINAIFSLIVSLMILPFVSNLNYVGYASKLVFILFKVVVLGMILGLFGYKFKDSGKATIFALLAGLFIVFTEFFDISSFRNLPSEYGIAALVIVVFGIMIWLITGSTSVTQSPAGEKSSGTSGRSKEGTSNTPESRGSERQGIPQAPEGYDIEKVREIPGEEFEKTGLGRR